MRQQRWALGLGNRMRNDKRKAESAIRDLRAVLSLKLTVDELIDELTTINSALYNSKAIRYDIDPVQSTPVNRMEALVEQKLAATERLEEAAKKYAERLTQTLERLEALPQDEADILRERYILRNTVIRAADKLYMSDRTVERKTRSGLINYYDKYLATEDIKKRSAGK